jgi:CTP synthase
LIEVGGTVGDIESLPFLEAIRQLGNELGEDAMFVHLTLVPFIASAGELKTKPTQHSVKELLNVGIQPDMLLCRCDRPIPITERRKIASFCNVRPEAVITAQDVTKTIYQVPLVYHAEGLDREVLRFFGLDHESEPDLSRWVDIVEAIQMPTDTVTVAVIGKYTTLLDSYKSLAEALAHGGIANKVKVELHWIDSEVLEETENIGFLSMFDGILVPGGFGERGTAGKIKAVRYAREHAVPFFGICFGMQLAVIETLRHIGGLDVSSTEFGPCDTDPAVGLLTEWAKDGQIERREAGGHLGGTMRLGSYPTVLRPGSLAKRLYGDAGQIDERHRHRYEVNLNYQSMLLDCGMRISGMSPDMVLPEIIERSNHPFFIGVQFHPELKSKPFSPHPLFVGFVAAALKQHFA